MENLIMLFVVLLGDNGDHRAEVALLSPDTLRDGVGGDFFQIG